MSAMIGGHEWLSYSRTVRTKREMTLPWMSPIAGVVVAGGQADR